MIVNILGTKYKITQKYKENDDKLSNKDGYCDFYSKEIMCAKFNEDKNDIDSARNLHEYEKKILRHEIIHAFFYESGLAHNSNTIDQWALDEELTDWIAIQYPKMMEVFKKCDAL